MVVVVVADFVYHDSWLPNNCTTRRRVRDIDIPRSPAPGVMRLIKQLKIAMHPYLKKQSKYSITAWNLFLYLLMYSK